jgi:hypothetical protein
VELDVAALQLLEESDPDVGLYPCTLTCLNGWTCTFTLRTGD